MRRAQGKSARMLQVERFLLAQREPIPQAEVARVCDVNRSTINRMLADLDEAGVPIYTDEKGRVAINRDAYLTNIRLTLDESMAVFLAARLLARYSDKPNPHTVEALLKLGLALEQGIAPQIGRHVVRTSEALRERHAVIQPNYLRTLETLTKAWSMNYKVRVVYRSLRGKRPFEHIFAPYFLEPSAIGYGTYAIGMAEPPGKIRTRKVERIESVALTGEPFEIPPDFDPTKLLAGAWGIWFDEEDQPTPVVLRFSHSVARRVRESKWHPSERVDEDEKTGDLIWRAEIDEWQEIVPWVRGWGADVEVLEPRELRNALTREAQELAELYQVVAAQARQMVYYAHSKDGADKSEWQKLINHLNRTANFAAEFGRDASVAELARIAGLIHDIGKYSKEFQARLDGAGHKVDHATAGAKELMQLFKGTPQEPLAVLLAYCISGHHTGLLDYGDSTNLPGDGTLLARLKTDVCNYDAYKTELDFAALEFPQRLHIRPLKGQRGFSLAFLTRMVYSALVDADFQETEEFMQGKKPRGEHATIETLRDRLSEHLRQFDNPQTDINRKRTETLRACVDKATAKPGFFTLTVPTGGGKTLASVAFALNHAATHGLKRVIYVIPFTTIIEQNAGVFKEILGEENVLEHHSNFDWEQKKREAIETAEDQTKSVYAKLRLAAENWDIPIVVTTNVQFFESLFANKSSRCRKLHNIAKSVIIFDEAQMFPKDYMLPAMGAVWELVTNYGASAVFCTATQPKLERFLPEGTKVTELAPNPQELFDFYKRVEVRNLGELPDEDLLACLNGHEQVLCIVNTRRHASGLFGGLRGEGNFHLSTLMCPTHRREKLAEIEKRLKSKTPQPCRVVSTTVMEAGIDLDFPVGYRALSGLDSINQAAGRVNREMRRTLGEVFVFEPDSEFVRRMPRYIAQGVEVTRGVLRDHGDAPISIPAIEAYFERLYSLKEPRDFDYKDILGCFDNQQPIYKFATVAERFRVIEAITETMIIPYDEEAKRLIEELKFTQYPSSTLRKLQPYTVSIFKDEFDALSSKGVIETIADAYAVLSDVENYYHPETGLLVPASGGGDGLFF